MNCKKNDFKMIIISIFSKEVLFVKKFVDLIIEVVIFVY